MKWILKNKTILATLFVVFLSSLITHYFTKISYDNSKVQELEQRNSILEKENEELEFQRAINAITRKLYADSLINIRLEKDSIKKRDSLKEKEYSRKMKVLNDSLEGLHVNKVFDIMRKEYEKRTNDIIN